MHCAALNDVLHQECALSLNQTNHVFQYNLLEFHQIYWQKSASARTASCFIFNLSTTDAILQLAATSASVILNSQKNGTQSGCHCTTAKVNILLRIASC